MNRIKQLFNKKQKDILSIYFTAGYPNLTDTGKIIKELEKNGIDLIEVGIPFSDPMADGPTIQESGTLALKNGMNLKLLFEQIKEVRKEVELPLLLMGYLNPIMQYGIENFCKKCKEVGVDGAIIPDLLFNDYSTKYKSIFETYDIKVIMLITPETSEERIRLIDENTDGFIYMVSSASTTGAQKSFDDKKVEYFQKINSMKLRNPRLIGFGISNKATLEVAQSYANGAIIGSKFITLLKDNKTIEKAVQELKNTLKT
ncbi:tryptophan synthase subunit alpha [Apibacter sp. B3889]|uniref:tryptophan synthase subunit alpha n=1 Tax=unclassified Apibacter TaxID=2630820 RepID=UPI001324D4D4|nr:MULTISPECIES: tryptophan synthase subunit alpha [unclassified Apibacter]MXO35063.1 tryptophan synthase subunit alpha [Apibacter sp. B3883]MXO42421.1 tryptophan synthase subunit alpha [Apibacter sp. B3889]MXP04438.1 tryptophan synthase subunit alpha [Apibacter sp. B3887]MXP08381.1 tryptophan synthase subunit alpha [Apibacter sp. B3935]